jgi:hypothetical protein
LDFANAVYGLVTETQRLDESRITVLIFRLQVFQKAATLTNEFQQPTAGMMILLVRGEMAGQLIDSLGDECDLNLGGTGIAFFLSELSDNLGLFRLMKRHCILLIANQSEVAWR